MEKDENEDLSEFYRDKAVLVTGGSGFIGTHIIQELLRRDIKVRATIHNRPMMVSDSRIEVIEADLTKYEHCLSAVKGIDCVFHAAGAVAAAGVNAINSMTVITVNLILAAQMLQASWEAGVERFLLFSSSTGYPVADHPVKEEEMWTGPTHPSYFGYGWERRYTERLSEFVASESGMKIAIVRPSAVYGPWDNFDLSTGHVIPSLIRKAVERADPYEVWGSGEEVRDFLYVSDLARGSLLMLQNYAECDGVNIGYGKAVTIKEIVGIILRATGYENAKVEFNTSKPTKIPFRMVDTSKAKRLFGFEPRVSLEEGLNNTVKWYLTKEGLK